MKRIIIFPSAVLISLFIIVSCSENNKVYEKSSTDLTHIKLGGKLAESELEASSLAWYNNNLIILPQFPHKWDDQFDGALFFIPKERIEKYLSGENRDSIKGEKIYFEADGLDEIGKSKVLDMKQFHLWEIPFMYLLSQLVAMNQQAML